MRKYTKILASVLAVACVAAGTSAMGLSAATAGDVDLDGTLGVTDIIALQKYLLGTGKLSGEGARNADVYADGAVNVFDLGMLKRMVLNGQTVEPTEPTQPSEEPTSEPTTEPTQPSESTGEGVVASIEYADNSVTLYDAAGAVVKPEDASNVTVNGTYVTVTKAGEYALSGSCANGQIKVSTDNTAEPLAEVTLSFAGLTLSNSTETPVFIENVGESATISVKKDTVNTISDGTSHTDTYTNSDGETVELNGAIFSKDDLKIKGKGTLNVNGNYKDGIVCKDDLKLWNGTINVKAVDDGIRGTDSVRIGDPDVMVANGGDGDYSDLNITVNTNNGSTGGDGIVSGSTDADKGFITVNGGTVTINSYADGIQAEQTVTINGGDLNITTYQGSTYGSTGSTGSTGGWGGGMDGNANKTDISAKGIKAVGLYDAAGTTWQSGGDITINGGTIKVDSSDDAIHCAGSMKLLGGVMTLSTADDAAHSDHDLTIGQGSATTFDDVQIYIPKCYEGIEASQITQNSGTVYIVSGDDGYNAGGGADGSGTGGMTGPGAGWGQGTTSSGTTSLTLNGGLGVVNSANGDHDAFDSNGTFTITGGYFCANGQEPCDYDGTFTNNGGSIITMTAGNTNLNTRYSFVDNSGKVIVSFLSAAGSPGATCSGCTAQSGGSVSGGTAILTQAPFETFIGGSLSGGSQITGSASTGGGAFGPGGR